MTPSEAASYLRVSEEDVMAAIEAGDLKARKLGSAFRISKSALDEFPVHPHNNAIEMIKRMMILCFIFIDF